MGRHQGGGKAHGAAMEASWVLAEDVDENTRDGAFAHEASGGSR